MPYKFEIKDAPNAVAMPVAEQPQDSRGNPALQAFKFKLDKVTAAIAVAQAELDVSDLKWETHDLEHGSETKLSAKINGFDGGPVRFTIEFEEKGKWKPYKMVSATVKDGLATATLQAHHPVLPPEGSLPSSAKLKAAQDVSLRFTVERGEP